MIEMRTAAMRLYRARSERVAAHAALKSYREKHGGCKCLDDEIRTPCFIKYQFRNGDWCAVCAGSQPLWERRKKASTEVGAAMKHLMSVCRKQEQPTK
jgi:hypothetical protein